jgi:hypothetical protein
VTRSPSTGRAPPSTDFDVAGADVADLARETIVSAHRGATILPVVRVQPGPYAPSWVDRLIDRIEALPGPSWVAYAVAAVATLLVAHASAWVDGYLDPGEFDLLLTSLAPFLVGGLAAIHYLDWAAARAWTTFRGATAMDVEEASTIAYRLTTMPARPVIAWTIVGLAVLVAYAAGTYGAPLDLEGEPVTFVMATALGSAAFAVGGALLYHTIHQLRLIAGLSGAVERIDLLDQTPLHAFSGITAVTGGIALAGLYINAVSDPVSFQNPAITGLWGVFVVAAVACFVAPLYGMHVKIAAEKARRVSDVNGRLDRALEGLHRRADTDDVADADRYNDHLASLLAERDVMARAPTWPWAPGTLGGFATALVLPVVLWFVYRFLDQALV